MRLMYGTMEIFRLDFAMSKDAGLIYHALIIKGGTVLRASSYFIELWLHRCGREGVQCKKSRDPMECSFNLKVAAISDASVEYTDRFYLCLDVWQYLDICWDNAHICHRLAVKSYFAGYSEACYAWPID